MVSSSLENIKNLVEKFKNNKEYYTSSKFDEENTKIEFINPFFEALGWDIHNKQEFAPQFKEVVFEDTIKIGGKAKAPDYSFRLGGQKIFFVEAKKPSVKINTDKNPAFQIKRYGWSAKLPLCILTDFEELAIYETTSKPDKNQNASIGRIKYYKYTEYEEKWDEIYHIISKEAVQKGWFDAFVTGQKGKKKGTSEVDEEFLKEINEWRLILARNIALRNEDITIEELNWAVQLLIDRIIFLRMAEDRGIEKYGQLQKLLELAVNKKDKYPVYEGFIKLCKKADLKYNSGLFHFIEEENISLDADNLTPKLNIDDSVFKQIFKNLYYPNCPYEFSMISPEILGNVYEQFLGKIIRLTEGHQAKIEEKPEVKKAGGIFYTPQYIVDYIVKNTIGELVKEKTPNQVSKLRFVDPACGSGSFLLGAYQYLLDWHLNYYSKLKKIPKGVIYTGKDGVLRLTINEKKRILTNNIYGVDIDSQAVETTKLSLLLKVLEDQNKDVVEAQQKLFQERALPYLGDNIKCGNSLIGMDILNNNTLNFDEIKKINPFDWEEEFPKIFQNGGFDIIIGNPPWGASFTNIELDYLKEKNKLIVDRMINSFLYFIFNFSKKLNKNGCFGMIIPDVILYQSSYKKLRLYLLNKFHLSHILNLGMGVFKNVNQPSAIIIFENNNSKNSVISGNFTQINANDKKSNLENKKQYNSYPQNIINNIPNYLFITTNINSYKIIQKIIKKCNFKLNDTLGEDKKIQRGASPDLKEAFIINEEIINKYNLEKFKIKKMVSGGFQIKKYHINYQDQYLIYTTKKDKCNEIPNICNYIKQFKDKITCKEVQKGKHPIYSLHRPRKEEIFLKDEKIMGVITADKLIVAIDNNQLYATDGVYLFSTNNKFNSKYIISVLNSNLYTFIYRLYSLENGRVLPQVKPSIIKELPFYPATLKKQEYFCELIDNITIYNKKLNECKTPKEKRLIEKQIEIIDNKINQLVYELYDLTDEEIKIIQENIK